MKILLHKFIDRAIDWVFRPPNLGVKLINAGASLVIAAIGINWYGKASFRDEKTSVNLDIGTSGGLPAGVSWVVFFLGTLLIIVGSIVAVLRFRQDHLRERRQKLIVVELRGLHASPDTPAVDADIWKNFKGERQTVRVDFRPKRESDFVDPKAVLEQVHSIKPTVAQLVSGRAATDIHLAVGGLAAVPAQFLLGMLIDDESHTTLYDWKRDVRAWHLLDGSDDGIRFLPLNRAAVPEGTKEAVLAVAVSYPIDEAALSGTFPTHLPIARLTAQEVVLDRCWSETKQRAMVSAFQNAIQELMALGVAKIHLVLSAPASLAIRMGMGYDRRLMPDILVYQYERSRIPPYPWAIQMPTHGRETGTVALPPQA